MAERPPARTPEDSHAEPKANGADHVPPPRLAADPDFFLDQEPEASDDSPTIISKNPPAAPATTAIAPEAFNNSLRGRTLAHFELIEPIGVGGMAAVIRARDKQLDRIVALKILPPETAADPENVRRFHHEARAAAKLDHENIARVFFYGEDQRLHFIAFEFVEGVNLRTLLERRGRLPVAEAVHYMLQIASGLAHAAGRGVVHRDIKPSNIIISPNGRAKLVDMGLARSLERHDDQALTQSGMTLGTFDYISPEQALEPRDADVRSDIYSLGCTFYHMLTGNPPVPEGTAARKLHHHQHVAPIDPRQLNSDIPDDVAALLARMMAKDPKERYQRPEHLVQHLIQVAQKVGAAAEVPDGVLFVDAPLPSPPQKRPLLMAALAAGVLALVLGALALAPPRSPSVVALVKPGGVDLRQGHPVQGEPSSRPVKVPETPRAHPDTRAANDEQELREAFAASHDLRPVVIEEGIDLKGQRVIFQGKPDQPLTVQSSRPDRAATLRLKYLPRTESTDPCVGIVVAGGTVVFKNLKFEIDAGKASQLGLVAAVVVKKDGSAVFEKCTFVQKAPVGRFLSDEAKALIPVASVAVEGGDGAGSPRMVTFKECYFQEGQDAIAVDGQADIRPTDCAFGKHNALFHLRAGRKGPLADLRLARCSAFVVGGPAFRLDGEAQCRLTITDSIFSVPENAGATSQHDEQHLIHQTGAMTPAVQYDGKRNCFHNLNALWGALPKLDGSEQIITDWDIFVAKTGKDVASTFLNPKVNPWNAADPLKVQVNDPKAAFRVNPDLREMRTVDARSALGIHKCAWGEEYAEMLPVLSPPRPVDTLVLRPNQKVVDPSALMSKDQVYPTLAGALEDAVSKDEILIKEGPNNRLVEVKPLRLNPDLKLTFKPYENHHPILTLAGTADEEDVALFRLGSGQLRFEQLEFLLRPDKKKAFKFQSVVAMKGSGQCAFNKCAFTLAGEDPSLASVRLSVVTLLDPRDAMKMLPVRDPPAPPAPPDIQLEDCFIRGKGECLTVRASRPFALGLENCIAVLAGSLLSVDGSSTEAAAQASARVKLQNVTTYLTDHLVQLRAAGNGKGLVPTFVTARNCLFAAAASKSFIHLFGPDSEKQMKELFVWDALGQHNAYAGFDKMLDQQATGDMMVMLRYDEDKWKTFANESVPPLFPRGKCFEVPADRPLSQAMPGDFRARADQQAQLTTYGSTLWRDGLPCLAGSEQVKPAPPPDE